MGNPKQVFAFPRYDIHYNDRFNLISKTLKLIPFRISNITLSGGLPYNVKNLEEALKFVKSKLNENYIMVFRVEGILFDKRLEVTFSSDRQPNVFGINLNSHDKGWLTAPNSEKEKINAILSKIDLMFKPGYKSHETEYLEISNRFNEKGFVITKDTIKAI